MTDLSDLELVDRLKRGDRLAFTALVRRWENPLLRVAARITGSLHEAEEVGQAVFLRLLQAPEKVRHPDRFAAWLRRSAVNEAISAVRRQTRRDRAMARMKARTSRMSLSDPSDALVALDETDRLHAAMARLKPMERALLALRFDEDLTFAEIADALGLPGSTVKSRLNTLISRLRTMLGHAPVR